MGDDIPEEKSEDDCCSGKQHEDKNKCCGKAGQETTEKEDCCSKELNYPDQNLCCARNGEDAEGSEDNCCFESSSIDSDGKCEDPCPNENVNFVDTIDEQWAGGVNSWDECSAKCRERTDLECKYWSWRRDTHDTESMQNTCMTMTGYGSAVTDDRIVSGTRDCLAEDFSQKDVDWRGHMVAKYGRKICVPPGEDKFYFLNSIILEF